MKKEDNRQWAVVEDGRLISTYGRKIGSCRIAREVAEARHTVWTGAKALLLSQEEIDRLK